MLSLELGCLATSHRGVCDLLEHVGHHLTEGVHVARFAGAEHFFFIYDAQTLAGLGHSGALDAYARIDHAAVERLVGSDPDHGDAFIADEARRVLDRSTFDALPIDVASPESLRRPPNRCGD